MNHILKKWEMRANIPAMIHSEPTCILNELRCATTEGRYMIPTKQTNGVPK